MLNPIETKERYLESLARLDELDEQSDQTPLDILEACEYSTLVHLICKYEDKHYLFDIPSNEDAIEFRAEQSGRDLSEEEKESIILGLEELRNKKVVREDI